MLQSYRPSGQCGSPFYLSVLGIVVGAAAAGWIYQKVINLVPFIYVNFLLTLGLGYGIVWAMGKVLSFGRCRSRTAALVAGILVSLAALGASHYSAFSSWQKDVLDAIETEQYQVLRQEGVPEEEWPAVIEAVRADFFEADTFGVYVDDRVEFGWTIGSLSSGLPISGLFVWVIWLIEAGMLLAAGWIGSQSVRGAAYCEQCDQWAETVHDQILAANPRRADIHAIRQATTSAELFPAGKVRFEDAHSHLWHLWKECPRCQKGFVDVAVLRYVPNDKGEVKTETDVLQANLILDEELQTAFEQASAAAKEAEKAAMTPPEPEAVEPS